VQVQTTTPIRENRPYVVTDFPNKGILILGPAIVMNYVFFRQSIQQLWRPSLYNE
jgi:hypothetical protein